MSQYPMAELTLQTDNGPYTSDFQEILPGKIYVLCEDWFWHSRGAVMVWSAKYEAFCFWDHGLFSAIRGLRHALVGYGLDADKERPDGETQQLTLSVATLNTLLRMLWDYRKLNRAEREQYATAMMVLAKEMQLVRDQHKVTARARISQARTVVDKLGRFNPPSRSPLVWSSRDLLKKRVVDIHRIAPWIDQRLFALLQMLDKVYAQVEGTIVELEGIIGASDRQRREFVQTVDLDRPDLCQHMINQLSPLAKSMRQPVVLPFRHGFDRSFTDLSAAISLLRLPEKSARDKKDILRYLDRARRSMLVYLIRRQLEPVIWRFSVEYVRGANRRPQVRFELVGDLTRFCRYLHTLEAPGKGGQDQRHRLEYGFRFPILGRVRRNLESAKRQLQANDWAGAKRFIDEALEPF